MPKKLLKQKKLLNKTSTLNTILILFCVNIYTMN